MRSNGSVMINLRAGSCRLASPGGAHHRKKCDDSAPAGAPCSASPSAC